MAASSSRLRSVCFRSVMSRMVLEISVPSSVSNGLRLISTGNSVPSLRVAQRSSHRLHRPNVRIGEKSTASALVRAAETVGNEHLDPLPQHLFSRVSKLLFRLGVDQDNLPLRFATTTASGAASSSSRNFPSATSLLAAARRFSSVSRRSVTSQVTPVSRSGVPSSPQ